MIRCCFLISDADERSHYNQLQDLTFFELTDRLMQGDREELYRNYDFQIRPATDNKPYFSQFLKLDRLSKMNDIFGQGSVPFLEVGYLIVLLTFFQIALAAILLILIPLFFIGFKGDKKAFTIVHFSSIGIGFMFVEMMLIQQLTLYFGHPIYAAAAVLSGMLLFAGLGAFFSEKIVKTKVNFKLILATIVLFISLLAFFLNPLIRATISQSNGCKNCNCDPCHRSPGLFDGYPFPFRFAFPFKKQSKFNPLGLGH